MKKPGARPGFLVLDPRRNQTARTLVMLDETFMVPCAACCTLWEISWVATPCSSTAAAMVEEISDSRSMVPLISLMAFTDSLVAAWMPEICWFNANVP
jgi:hypothetical protein